MFSIHFEETLLLNVGFQYNAACIEMPTRKIPNMQAKGKAKHTCRRMHSLMEKLSALCTEGNHLYLIKMLKAIRH